MNFVGGGQGAKAPSPLPHALSPNPLRVFKFAPQVAALAAACREPFSGLGGDVGGAEAHPRPTPLPGAQASCLCSTGWKPVLPMLEIGGEGIVGGHVGAG